MKKTKKYPMIYIAWIDAQIPHRGWSDEDEINHKGSKIETCGFLLKKTKKTYSIAQNIALNGDDFYNQISNIINIPSSLIVKEKIISI